MPEIDSGFNGIGYMVSVLVEGAIDNQEPIFEDLLEAEKCADAEKLALETDCPRGYQWEILISEVAVGEDSIEGSPYQTDSGLYAKGVGRSDT